MALVTDRGTPLISDPGYVVVKEVIKSGFSVVSLPGPSALLPALNMSGIPADKFLFYGFLSNKVDESISELKMLKSINFTIVLYESPHRLIKTLQNMKDILGNKIISISREISKVYEEVFRGTIDEALNIYIEAKGEFVIVIDNNEKNSKVKQGQEPVYLVLYSNILSFHHTNFQLQTQLFLIHHHSEWNIY